MRKEEGIGSLFRAAMLAIPVTVVTAASAQAEGETATVSLTDGRNNRTYDQVIQCDDYMLLNGQLYTTNAVASQIDIKNDIRLDTWEPIDVVDMASLEELSPSLHQMGSQFIAGGYSEADVVLWARTQIAAAIEQRTMVHLRDMHRVPEDTAMEAIRSAGRQCTVELGL